MDALVLAIEGLEREQATLRAELADGGLYGRDPDRANHLYRRDAEVDAEMLAAMERWDQLSARQGAD